MEGINFIQRGIDFRITEHDPTKQDVLVSGENIKTVNGESLVGSGNVQANGAFKGWFDDETDLMTRYPSPMAGDFAYVEDASPAQTVSIYKSVAGTWCNSGKKFNPANNQEFESGEQLNQTRIDDTNLMNPNTNSLPKAEDVMQLKAKLDGVTASEVKVNAVVGTNVTTGAYVSGETGLLVTPGSSASSYAYFELAIPQGTKSIRFATGTKTSSAKIGYSLGHYEENVYVPTRMFYFDVAETTPPSGIVEKTIEVLEGETTFMATVAAVSTYASITLDNFYCYLQSGESVGEKLVKKVEVDKIPYIDYSQFIVWDSTKYVKGSLHSGSMGNAGYTDFIPVGNIKGLYCSNPFAKGSGSILFTGGYIYNENKEYIGNIGSSASPYTSMWYVKQDGHAYVRFNLAENAVITELTDEVIPVPSDISNYEALKISKAATVGGQRLFLKKTGKNLCNPDKITVKTGLYIGSSSGNVTYSSSLISAKGVTDFINMCEKTVVCNSAYYGGTTGYACYDENYVFTHGGQSSVASWRPGDRYVRFTLNAVTDIQVENGTSPTDYEPYTENIIFNEDFIKTKFNEIKTYEQGVDIVLPSIVYCTNGDTVYLYFRSFIEAVNPKAFDCCSPNSNGVNGVLSYPDCIKVTRTTNASFNVVVRDNALNEVAKKVVSYKAVDAPVSPSSPVNILLVGASREASGVTAVEVYRRLVGDNSMSPTGLGLTNINFVGRKSCKAYDCDKLGYPSSLYTQVKHEAVSGKKIHDMVVAGDLTGYTFYFVPDQDYVFNQGDKYTDGTRVYTVVGSDPTTGDLQVSITSGSGTPSATGTLTLTEGSGTASVEYTSYENETSNPFWNSSTGKIDFAKYSTDHCGGATIDILILSRVMNDLYNNRTPSQISADYKTVIDAFHEYNANGRIVVNLVVLPSINGGLPHSYTNGKPLTTGWQAARMTLETHKALIGLAESDEYKDFCLLSNTNAEFDLDYYYSKEATEIRNRGVSKTANYDNNGLHFGETGKQVVADSIYHCVCKIINDINEQ